MDNVLLMVNQNFGWLWGQSKNATNQLIKQVESFYLPRIKPV